MEIIPATEANRRFSELLRGVKEEGRSYMVTSHGRAVARVMPVEDEVSNVMTDPREQAWAEIETRWKTQSPITVSPWTRDELYQRGNS